MEKIKGTDIIQATSGVFVSGNSEAFATSVSIDSRTVREGAAFFALPGEKVDGHDFIPEAVRKGATVIITEKDNVFSCNHDCQSSPLIIKVNSGEEALQELAAAYLNRFNICKIAVTGSTGKTTTKEMLQKILSEKYKTVSNKGNFNNLIGLPLSAFDVDSTTEMAIFEMGMDRLGEIHRLAEIVRPHIAIITNIGISHLSRLGSKDNILKAKLEICDFLKDEDMLILNADDDFLSRSDISERINSKIIKVGNGQRADILIKDVKDSGEKGVEFRMQKGTELSTFRIAVPGLHNVMNAGLAVTAALNMNVSMESAAEGLAKFEAGDKRLHIISSGGIKIIDDTYNASPDSMKAALDVLASIKSNRKLAILGDMFELGDDEEKYHKGVGEYASQKGINVVISVGKNARYISHAAKENGTEAFHFDEKDMLINVMAQWIRKGDAILIKGSRGMAMDEIAEQLKLVKK